MYVEQEHFYSQKSSTKLQSTDYDFDPGTSRSNNNCQLTVSSSNNHLNNGNGDHGDGCDCYNNGDVGIGDNDDDVGNDGNAGIEGRVLLIHTKQDPYVTAVFQNTIFLNYFTVII